MTTWSEQYKAKQTNKQFVRVRYNLLSHGKSADIVMIPICMKHQLSFIPVASRRFFFRYIMYVSLLQRRMFTISDINKFRLNTLAGKWLSEATMRHGYRIKAWIVETQDILRLDQCWLMEFDLRIGAQPETNNGYLISSSISAPWSPVTPGYTDCLMIIGFEREKPTSRVWISAAFFMLIFRHNNRWGGGEYESISSPSTRYEVNNRLDFLAVAGIYSSWKKTLSWKRARCILIQLFKILEFTFNCGAGLWSLWSYNLWIMDYFHNLRTMWSMILAEVE